MRLRKTGKTAQPHCRHKFKNSCLHHAEFLPRRRLSLLFRQLRMRETLILTKKELIEALESLGMRQGFLLYRTTLRGPLGKETIRLRNLHDRAQVWIDGVFAGDVWRSADSDILDVEINKDNAILDVLVENTGYVNYGPACGTERKGIDQILVNFERQDNFIHFPLEMEDDVLGKIKYRNGIIRKDNTPVFIKGYFDVDVVADTFIKFPGHKGCIWINGFNIGKYWNIGPDTALYVPSALLKKGRNEIIVFEQYKINETVEFQDYPGLGDFQQ